MAFAPQLDEVNTVTQKKILPGVVDNYFKAGPFIAMCKTRYNRRWNGPQIQENFLYDSPQAGSYLKGATFPLIRKQTKTGLLFTPRYYRVSVTEFLEDIEVELAGDMAAFSTVKQDLDEAALAISACLEIAAFHHGQAIPGDDRSADINGLEEAFTDGSNATWTGTVFPSYGGQLRAGVRQAGLVAGQGALDSPLGVISTPNVTQTSFRTLHHTYLSAKIGKEHPQLGITTNAMMGFIAESFFPHQLIDVRNPEIDWPGFKMNQATIVDSQYAPGTQGVNDPNLGNYLSTNGETFWWVNFGPTGEDAYIRLHIAASPKFAFGFTGFKGARGDNMVAGQILFAGNMSVRTPRLQRALYGFTR
jgi:hypothetical protein